MNLRTADRLRFTVKLVNLVLAISALWLALVAGRQIQDLTARLDKVERVNRSQTRALTLVGDILDGLIRMNPETPQFAPLPMPLPPLLVPETNSFTKTNARLDHSTKNRLREGASMLTATEQLVAFRETGAMPTPLTLRFLALLTKKELAELSRKLKLAIDNHELPATGGRARKRRQWAQFERVQSERRQRGHIK